MHYAYTEQIDLRMHNMCNWELGLRKKNKLNQQI